MTPTITRISLDEAVEIIEGAITHNIDKGPNIIHEIDHPTRGSLTLIEGLNADFIAVTTPGA